MALERKEDPERPTKMRLRRDPRIYASNVDTPPAGLPLTPDPESGTFQSTKGLSSNNTNTIIGRGLTRSSGPESPRQGLYRNTDYYKSSLASKPGDVAVLEDDPYARYVTREHQDILGTLPRTTIEYRGLRRVNPTAQISSAAIYPKERYSREFSVSQEQYLERLEGIPPLRPAEQPTGNVLVMDQEVIADPKQRSAIPAIPSFTDILYENEYIGHHRFIYTVNRLPALISVVISLWILYGKMDSDLRKRNETLEAILALTTGLFILAGELYGLHNHNNSHKHAFIQTLARAVHLALKIPLSIATIVFSLLAIYDIKEEDNAAPPTVQGGAMLGYSQNERLTHSAVLLGMSLMVFFLSIIALIYGILATRKLIADIKKEKMRKQQALYPAENTDQPAEHFHTM